jgi:hypothetical protein
MTNELKNRDEMAAQFNIGSVADYVAKMELKKDVRKMETFFKNVDGVQQTVTALQEQNYSLVLDGKYVGSIGKGWTRNGGNGWVITYVEGVAMHRQSTTQKNLKDAVRTAAYSVRARDIANAQLS